MKHLFFALLLFAAVPAFAETHYSTVITDLPLMEGMTERADESVTFDDPTGRIVETVTTRPAGDVAGFYRTALPPLGWREVRANVYRRDGENLTVTLKPDAVQFKINPAKE